MVTPNEPLSTSILVIMYFGDVVFAVSGALTAALLGSLSYATLNYLAVPRIPAEAIACSAAFSLRACAIIFDLIHPLNARQPW